MLPCAQSECRVGICCDLFACVCVIYRVESMNTVINYVDLKLYDRHLNMCIVCCSVASGFVQVGLVYRKQGISKLTSTFCRKARHVMAQGWIKGQAPGLFG